MKLKWGKSGKGKWYKRKLHKAERRAAREVIDGRKVRRSLAHWNSEVNWKGT